MSGRGSQGPSDAQRPGPFVREGAFFLPPQALFFTRTFSRPRFFFFFCFFFWPSGPAHSVESKTRCQSTHGVPNSERCSENTPELSEKSRSPTHPPPLLRFFVNFRGKCCAFFYGAVFREIPLIVLGFFTVLLVLGLLFEGFFGTNSGAGVGWGELWIFVWKMLQFPRNL